MKKLQKKQAGLRRRHTRVRGKISGTAERPRLCITRSNANMYAQVIDDVTGKTICALSTLGPDFKKTGKTGATVEGAAELGKLIGKLLLLKQLVSGIGQRNVQFFSAATGKNKGHKGKEQRQQCFFHFHFVSPSKRDRRSSTHSLQYSLFKWTPSVEALSKSIRLLSKRAAVGGT